MNLKEKAYFELNETLSYLQNWDYISKQINTNNISLLSGLTSILVVLIDSYKVYPELVKKDSIKFYLSKLNNILYETNVLIPSYCSGIAGYGFFLLKLKETNLFFDNSYNMILDEIDEVLSEFVNIEMKENNLDILHGVLGIGLYFIQRGKIKLVNNIIDNIDENSIVKNKQIYWKRFDKYHSQKDVYDFGLAHGNASYLYFLSKCKSKGISNININKLIRGIINFYAENTQKIQDNIYSFYPSYFSKDEFDAIIAKPQNSRLAWCYGDLGVLHTLLLTANLLNDKILKSNVIDKLIVVSQRKIENEPDDIEANFCHGTRANAPFKI